MQVSVLGLTLAPFCFKTKMYVEEHTGADADQNAFFRALSKTKMFLPRDVRMAEWQIQGCGPCCSGTQFRLGS